MQELLQMPIGEFLMHHSGGNVNKRQLRIAFLKRHFDARARQINRPIEVVQDLLDLAMSQNPALKRFIFGRLGRDKQDFLFKAFSRAGLTLGINEKYVEAPSLCELVA